ncbi:hypothetical protein Pelo_18115 [Pelomyxa schiedti]|nr:hypothetical protein Pelo_18115 [Pelomyxa schiedti]
MGMPMRKDQRKVLVLSDSWIKPEIVRTGDAFPLPTQNSHLGTNASAAGDFAVPDHQHSQGQLLTSVSRKINESAAKLAAKSTTRIDVFPNSDENIRIQSSHQGENSMSTAGDPSDPDRVVPGRITDLLFDSMSPPTFQTFITLLPGSSTTIHFLLPHASYIAPMSSPAIHTTLASVAESHTPTSSTSDTSTTHRSGVTCE